MAFTPVQNLQLHKQIDRVLHVPGNYKGGILEMAVVIDCAYSKDAISALCADIVVSCKFMSEIFRNVRLNVVKWSCSGIQSDVTAMAYLQMGSYFDSYISEEDHPGQKSPEELMAYLKKFHARSKLVLLLTKDSSALALRGCNQQGILEALNPFLKQKLVIVYPDHCESGSDYARKLILGDH